MAADRNQADAELQFCLLWRASPDVSARVGYSGTVCAGFGLAIDEYLNAILLRESVSEVIS